jgi:hypothetical protein
MGTKSVDMVLKVSTAAAAITEDPTAQTPESLVIFRLNTF